MKRFTVLISSLLLLAAVGYRSQAAGDDTPKENSAAEKAAIKSAEAWLALLDSGDFAKSWDEAATYVKALVSQADWEKTFGAARTPLGKAKSRKLISQQYATSLPGAPDGEYVVIQYQTVFENKATAVETITPMLDKDNKWRMSGYYIK